MNLIRPSFEILTDNVGEIEVLQLLEKVARTCYKSEDRITIDGESAKKIVKLLLSKNHEAMLEFYDVIVKFTCDRGVSHEIVRHRIGSFAQESTRYVNYSVDGKSKGCTFIIPQWISDEQIEEVQKLNEKNYTKIESTTMDWYHSMATCEQTYNSLLKAGWKPEQARSVLPNSTKTEINVKFNLRAWRHFFKLRTASAAHPQMRELTIPLLEVFKQRIPLLFDDIIVS